jgi:LPS O-antigen subunit length determinant protein (WzzB/FepE family)
MVELPRTYVKVSRRPPDLEDCIDMLRRYRSWIIGPTFACLVAAVVTAFLWPDTYVSLAVMRITPPQVPQSLAPSAINPQMNERLTQMETEILSRTSLSELIQRPLLNLYPKQRKRMPIDDVVEGMRNDIKIGLLDHGRPTPGRVATVFTIQYKYTDKYKAQAVVRELVRKFTEQNNTVPRNESTLTTSFLNDEYNAAKQKMDALDAEITRFKTENQGHLPQHYQPKVAALTARDDFDSKAKRRETSETSQNLEKRKTGENLEVLDPASLPEKRSEPKRLAIVGMGAGAGLILGIVLAGAKEMKNTSLKNLKDVRAYTNLPVLSSIPLLQNPVLVRRRRRLFWLAWSTAIIIGTAAMSGSVFYYYSTCT